MKMWLLIFFIGASSALSVIDPSIQLSHQRGIYGISIEEKTLRIITSKPVTSESDKTLDVSSLGIKKIENHVFDNLMNVTILNLSNNKLEMIPPLIFVKLKSLQTLSLANNKLRVFDRSFIGLRNLKSLDLSNNLIKSLVTGDLFGLPKIVNLTTYGNPIEKFIIDSDNSSTSYYLPSESDPTPWTNRKFYVELPVKMYDNVLMFFFIMRPRIWSTGSMYPTNVPAYNWDDSPWDKCSINGDYLKLCMSDEGVVESLSVAKKSEALGDCTNVTQAAQSMYLYLNDLNITGFDPMWYRIRKDLFTTVILSSKNIIDISSKLFVNLPDSIITVSLERNSIERIKKNTIQNKYLKKISFAFNKIKEIEDDAFAETNLVSISLTHNDLGDNLNFIKTLPVTIEVLQLSWNNISNISEDFITNLIALRELDLSYNYISNLSVNTFRGLKKLWTINLSMNHLTAIEPGTFEDQGELSNLYLSTNKITKINPGIFSGLKSLSSLSLKGNKITKIGRDTFSELRHSTMNWLDLSRNEIDTIEGGSFSYMTIRSLNIIYNNLKEESFKKGAFEFSTLEIFFCCSDWDKDENVLVRDGALLYSWPARNFEKVIYTDE